MVLQQNPLIRVSVIMHVDQYSSTMNGSHILSWIKVLHFSLDMSKHVERMGSGILLVKDIVKSIL